MGNRRRDGQQPVIQKEYTALSIEERMKYGFPNNRIASLRKQAQLSQSELGERLGVSQRYISDWEIGVRVPSIAQAMVIAALFEVTVYELMGVPEAEVLSAVFGYEPPSNENPAAHKIPLPVMEEKLKNWGHADDFLGNPQRKYHFLGDWQRFLPIWALERAYYLRDKVMMERNGGAVLFPEDHLVFRALNETKLEDVRVVIVGRSPYCKKGQADGLALSRSPSAQGRYPGTLTNLLYELKQDLSIPAPRSGDLTPWAKRGVLLLNAILTTYENETNGCVRKEWGWDDFTGAVLHACSLHPRPKVFLLLGTAVAKMEFFIQKNDAFNRVISLPHPSPVLARDGFLGSKPFSRINALLQEMGAEPMDWRLP